MVFFQIVPCYELMQVVGKPSSFGVRSILAGSQVVLFGRVRSILAGSQVILFERVWSILAGSILRNSLYVGIPFTQTDGQN
jgi:predicted Co/Zn/Cd cation transporter (cation efflux family)